MDAGEIGIIIAIVVGVGALMWQVHSQGNRLDRRIDSFEDRLSDTALAAARNEGRNDVLAAHTHTHEQPGAAD